MLRDLPIELVNLRFLTQGVTEGLEVLEFVDRCLVDLFYRFCRRRTQSFLIVTEQKTSEVCPLKEVFALVFGPGHRQYVSVGFALCMVGVLRGKFQFHLVN